MKIIQSLLLAFAVQGFAANDPANFTVHEWGTFTSVQGGDGSLVRWQATQIGDLPKFVYNWTKPGLNHSAR